MLGSYEIRVNFLQPDMLVLTESSFTFEIRSIWNELTTAYPEGFVKFFHYVGQIDKRIYVETTPAATFFDISRSLLVKQDGSEISPNCIDFGSEISAQMYTSEITIIDSQIADADYGEFQITLITADGVNPALYETSLSTELSIRKLKL